MTPADPLAAVARALSRHDSFVITCHVDPDPDCVGSMLGLAWGLRRLGKKVAMVSDDPLGEELLFLPGADEVRQPPAPAADALVIVDCDSTRIGAVRKQMSQFEYVYNIDHHVTNPGEGTLYYVDPQAAATAEIIFRLLTEHWRLSLDEEVATNLYAAVMSDTGSFRFSNTTAATLHIAARLVTAGARPADIASSFFDDTSWSAMQLLKLSLNTLSRTADGRIAWMFVTRDMLAEAGAGDDDSSGFVQYPRSLRGVEAAMLLRELPDGQTRVSLRSRGRVDVSAVAGAFGGGGHPGASGCTVNAPIAEALEQLLAELQKALPRPVEDEPPAPEAGGR